ncbi:DNA polymerase III subunit beta [Dactylosporangium sp. NPDC049742]|uniref:DNA polymerase III subunit beta n=1 Tax=Dactylosporangium sp. NPDC049742 TaxID=3154737 RepID=UPI00341483D0
MDVTASVSRLAAAASFLLRMLTGRSLQPSHAGVLLRADDAGLHLVATDGEVVVHLHTPATVHTPGEVVVPRRAVADTLTSLDAADARLTVQGGRLSIRVPGARFALPSLPDATPPPVHLPPAHGTVTGDDLRTAAVPVAGAASREHALPLFTGVRLRAHTTTLSLLATDRFRLAAAAIPWHPTATPAPLRPPSTTPLATPTTEPTAHKAATARAAVDALTPTTVPATETVARETATGRAGVEALVPAAVLARAAQHLSREETIHVHADDDLFALSWDGGSITTPTLGTGYPDAQMSRLLDISAICTVETDADTLAQAVDRATAYGGPHGRVTLQPIEGALLVHADDPLTGESEQTLKATTDGTHVVRSFQARLLLDALRAFPHHPVRLQFQPDLRATAFTASLPTTTLNYLVVPLRTPPTT